RARIIQSVPRASRNRRTLGGFRASAMPSSTHSRTSGLPIWTCRTARIVCGRNARRSASISARLRLKVSLERAFPMPASADQAWALRLDAEAVAGCMPGARPTERVADPHYKGAVGVRSGPANMSFRGEIEVAALEPQRRTLRLVGRGTDSAGG